MFGARPLNDGEINKLMEYFKDHSRNRLIVILGIRTGFRVSELLSIKIEKLLNKNGEIVDTIYLDRKNMKGKKRGRYVPIHQQAKVAIKEFLQETGRTSGYLFKSRKTRADGKEIALTPGGVWRILTDAYKELGMDGKIAVHGLRKTFAQKVYEKTGNNLLETQQALGHANVNSTQHYLQCNRDKVNQAILGID